jgi:hypothetical protein
MSYIRPSDPNNPDGYYVYVEREEAIFFLHVQSPHADIKLTIAEVIGCLVNGFVDDTIIIRRCFLNFLIDYYSGCLDLPNDGKLLIKESEEYERLSEKHRQLENHKESIAEYSDVSYHVNLTGMIANKIVLACRTDGANVLVVYDEVTGREVDNLQSVGIREDVETRGLAKINIGVVATANRKKKQ